ncbi:hypothetical protein HZV92_001829 [Salmonella enterica]|nr:hypothetical protein [Salmonella enterica]EFQ6618168.1 hypothetical protein [Salmonella enterica]
MSATFFGHPVQVVGGLVEPDCTLADSAMLAGWKDAEECVQRARKQAAQRILRSRDAARKNRQRQTLKMEARLAAQSAAGELACEEARRQAVDDAVQWLVAESALEKTLYQQALKTACGWAMVALQRWQGDIDWSTLLNARIGEMQATLSGEQGLMLRLAPGEFADKLRQENALKEEHSGPLRIVIDDTLSARQAILGNQLVQVTIDLEKEFAGVMVQLTSVFSYMETENGPEC